MPMQYTKAERAKMAAAFKHAKQFLLHSMKDAEHSNGTRFICLSLEFAYEAGLIEIEEVCRCKRVVSSRLDGQPSLAQWLQSRGHFSMDEYLADGLLGNPKLQATRHAWIDSLIKEFSK